MKHHHGLHDAYPVDGADAHHLTLSLLWALVIPMLVGMALAGVAIWVTRRKKLS